jgi:hypothetical protein
MCGGKVLKEVIDVLESVIITITVDSAGRSESGWAKRAKARISTTVDMATELIRLNVNCYVPDGHAKTRPIHA